MGVLIVSGLILAVAIMMMVAGRQSLANVKKTLKEEQERTLKLQQKMQSSQEEYRKNKEELERGKEALREARELTKKKLRTAGNAKSEHQDHGNEEAMTTKAFDDSKKALSAMESQIEQLKNEQHKSEELIRAQLVLEMKKEQEKGESAEAELKKKVLSLKDELKKQKNLMRPEGHKIDLKTLPDEAACEFARIYRKAEQHERLHGIARAKLHLAQEKFSELQRRYFEVCRELALAANKSDAPAQNGTNANPEEKKAMDDLGA